MSLDIWALNHSIQTTFVSTLIDQSWKWNGGHQRDFGWGYYFQVHDPDHSWQLYLDHTHQDEKSAQLFWKFDRSLQIALQLRDEEIVDEDPMVENPSLSFDVEEYANAMVDTEKEDLVIEDPTSKVIEYDQLVRQPSQAVEVKPLVKDELTKIDFVIEITTARLMWTQWLDWNRY